MNWFLNSMTSRRSRTRRRQRVTFQGNGSNIIYVDWENDLVVVVRWIRQSAFNEFIGQVLSSVGTRSALYRLDPQPVDLLVFGPHPDDLEIGLGGTSRSMSRAGDRVGLCDLTAGEMGSNGTVDERLAEAEAARVVLGAAWRDQPALARSRDRQQTPSTWLVLPPRSSAQATSARGRDPLWHRSPSRSCRREPGIDRSRVQHRPAPISTPALATQRGSRSGSATTSSTIQCPPSFVVDVSAYYEQQAPRAAVPREPVHGQRRTDGVADAADVAALPAARREPRRAVRRARRRPLGRGLRRPRADRCGRTSSDENIRP